jgi:transcriptional regulator with XRE-family HTH domain/mannose-6-phosphate isomerase-like protein (cupin superfamily)
MATGPGRRKRTSAAPTKSARASQRTPSREPETADAAPSVNLGARLRAVRQASGLSVREAARQLGVSASFVSQLETGKSQPSVATLYSLSQLLDVSIDELFGSDEDFQSRLQRHAQGEALADPAVAVGGVAGATRHVSRSDFGSPGEAWAPTSRRPRLSITRPSERPRIVMDSGVVWEQLASNTGADLDFMEVVYPAGSSSTTDNRMLRHEGYEYGLLIEGELQVTVGFETFSLRAGEALGFDSSTPHLFRNDGTVPARGIWCVRHPHE